MKKYTFQKKNPYQQSLLHPIGMIKLDGHKVLPSQFQIINSGNKKNKNFMEMSFVFVYSVAYTP